MQSLWRVGFICLCIVAFGRPAVCQVFPFSPYYDVSDSIQEIDHKTAALDQMPLLKNDILLSRELDRIDTETNSTLSAKASALNYKRAIAQIEQYLQQLSKSAQAIAGLTCEADLETFSLEIGNYIQTSNAIAALPFTGSIDLNKLRTAPSIFGPDAEACKRAKAKFADAEFIQSSSGVRDELRKAAGETTKKQDDLLLSIAKYIDALQARRVKIQEVMSKSQPTNQIGQLLPYLIFELALACVATILGIKLFDEPLQMEWVASGQVIQFVTVMILLSVILALGLSTILKENTLGTLLGGIAGYVLAQGVGKAAARDVARTNSQVIPRPGGDQTGQIGTVGAPPTIPPAGQAGTVGVPQGQ